MELAIATRGDIHNKPKIDAYTTIINQSINQSTNQPINQHGGLKTSSTTIYKPHPKLITVSDDCYS